MPSTGAAFGNVGLGKVPRAQRGWVMQERVFEPLAPEQGAQRSSPDRKILSRDQPESSPFPPQVQNREL